MYRHLRDQFGKLLATNATPGGAYDESAQGAYGVVPFFRETVGPPYTYVMSRGGFAT